MHYRYYLHGPLAREELGERKVQGIDYAYTLQGWLKGMSNTHLEAGNEIGKDGLPGTSYSTVARDAIGFSLGYYDGQNITGMAMSS